MFLCGRVPCPDASLNECVLQDLTAEIAAFLPQLRCEVMRKRLNAAAPQGELHPGPRSGDPAQVAKAGRGQGGPAQVLVDQGGPAAVLVDQGLPAVVLASYCPDLVPLSPLHASQEPVGGFR